MSSGSIAKAALLAAMAMYGHRVSGPSQSSPSSLTIFDSNPNHIWNRTYSCLFVRRDERAEEYGADVVDPLLWYTTGHLLTGESHGRALACLDDFLRSRGELLVQDPVKRAILQHDLWALFDWVAAESDLSQQRRALETRLAEAIRRLALTPEQIQALPDNYSAAAAAGRFATDYDRNKPQQPFLPADLLHADGPWICLTGYSRDPTALVHFTGRSRFLVFIKLPGGRDATLAYIEKLRSSSKPPMLGNGPLTRLNLAVPQFPVGTELALLRQVIAIDNTGSLVPTRLTESVQFRAYHAITPGTAYINYINGPSSRDQDFFEFRMSRAQLFADHVGGLVAVDPGEHEFATFMTHGQDPFESPKSREVEQSAILERCRACHSDSGIHSVQSRTRWMKQPVEMNGKGSGDALTWESHVTIARKEQQGDFKQLQALWQRSYR